MARGEIEQDIVELVISSQTQTPASRPAGLPPVRRAFQDLAVFQHGDSVTRQQREIPSSDMEIQAQMQQTGSRVKNVYNVLFYAMAYAICVFIYLMAAFIIGKRTSVSVLANSGQLNLTGMPFQLSLEISFSKVRLCPGHWPLVWQLFLR